MFRNLRESAHSLDSVEAWIVVSDPQAWKQVRTDYRGIL
jgi:hypothetical protein